MWNESAWQTLESSDCFYGIHQNCRHSTKVKLWHSPWQGYSSTSPWNFHQYLPLELSLGPSPWGCPVYTSGFHDWTVSTQYTHVMLPDRSALQLSDIQLTTHLWVNVREDWESCEKRLVPSECCEIKENIMYVERDEKIFLQENWTPQDEILKLIHNFLKRNNCIIKFKTTEKSGMVDMLFLWGWVGYGWDWGMLMAKVVQGMNFLGSSQAPQYSAICFNSVWAIFEISDQKLIKNYFYGLWLQETKFSAVFLELCIN